MGIKKIFEGVCLTLLFALPEKCAAAPSAPTLAYTTVASSFSVAASSWALAVTTASWRTVSNTAFREGEELSFTVRWGLIKAGRSVLAIPGIESVANRPAYHLVSEAHSAGLVSTFYRTQDRNESWLDVQSLSTLRYEKHIREGHYRIDENVEIDQVNRICRDYSNRLDKGTTEYNECPLPLNVLDVLGSLYYVRTRPLIVGQSYILDVYDGKKVWALKVNVEKREMVRVPAGKFDCFRVEPLLRQPGIFINKGKNLQVWLTADQAHMPVLMRSEIFIGHVSAELTSYKMVASTPTPTSNLDAE